MSSDFNLLVLALGRQVFQMQILQGRDFKAFPSLSCPHPVPANTGRCRHVRRCWGSKSSLGKGGWCLDPELCTCSPGRGCSGADGERQGIALGPVGRCWSQPCCPEWRPAGPVPPASPHGGPKMSFSPICEAEPRRLVNVRLTVSRPK